MAKKTSTTGKAQRSREELLREIAEKKAAAAKMRLGLQMGSEKDSARYRRERKEIARLATQLSLGDEPLNAKKKGSTLSAPATSA